MAGGPASVDLGNLRDSNAVEQHDQFDNKLGIGLFVRTFECGSLETDVDFYIVVHSLKTTAISLRVRYYGRK